MLALSPCRWLADAFTALLCRPTVPIGAACRSPQSRLRYLPVDV